MIKDDKDNTDVVPEPDYVEGNDLDELSIEASGTQKIKQIKSKLKDCEEEKRSLLEDLQRSKADFLNSKKRLEIEFERKKDQLEQGFIEDLLPLSDSFAMAMSDKAVWDQVDSNWRRGIEGINSQLKNVLKNYNVVEIAESDVSFDPNYHEALVTEKVDSIDKDHKVTKIIQAGYVRIKDNVGTVIRPARVVVGEFNKDNPE